MKFAIYTPDQVATLRCLFAPLSANVDILLPRLVLPMLFALVQDRLRRLSGSDHKQVAQVTDLGVRTLR